MMIRSTGRGLGVSRALADALLLARKHVTVRNRALDRASVHARDLIDSLERDDDRELARKLLRELELAHRHAHALSKVVRQFAGAAGAGARVFSAALVLHLVVVRSQALADALDDRRSPPHGNNAAGADDGGRLMPGRVSGGLTALAVLLLPVPFRNRYRAEFLSELVALPRHERVGYSLRVLASAWRLRRALPVPKDPPDGTSEGW